MRLVLTIAILLTTLQISLCSDNSPNPTIDSPTSFFLPYQNHQGSRSAGFTFTEFLLTCVCTEKKLFKISESDLWTVEMKGAQFGVSLSPDCDMYFTCLTQTLPPIRNEENYLLRSSESITFRVPQENTVFLSVSFMGGGVISFARSGIQSEPSQCINAQRIEITTGSTISVQGCCFFLMRLLTFQRKSAKLIY